MAWSTRYKQYARHEGLTPNSVLLRDRAVFPGGKMVGFILWSTSMVRGWCKASGIDEHWAGLHLDEIDAWIELQLGWKEGV